MTDSKGKEQPSEGMSRRDILRIVAAAGAGVGVGGLSRGSGVQAETSSVPETKEAGDGFWDWPEVQHSRITLEEHLRRWEAQGTVSGYELAIEPFVHHPDDPAKREFRLMFRVVNPGKSGFPEGSLVFPVDEEMSARNNVLGVMSRETEVAPTAFRLDEAQAVLSEGVEVSSLDFDWRVRSVVAKDASGKVAAFVNLRHMAGEGESQGGTMMAPRWEPVESETKGNFAEAVSFNRDRWNNP